MPAAAAAAAAAAPAVLAATDSFSGASEGRLIFRRAEGSSDGFCDWRTTRAHGTHPLHSRRVHGANGVLGVGSMRSRFTLLPRVGFRSYSQEGGVKLTLNIT